MSRSTNGSDEDGTNPKYLSESSFVDESNLGSSDGVVALKKGPWTASEDAILVDYVKKHGEGNWNAVQKHSGLVRCGKSCRLRWANHLRPNLKKGAFTPEEEALILELHVKLGNKWARMASHLPGRTDNEIKNYWNTRIKRRQRAGLDVYPPGLAQQHAFLPENQLGGQTPQDLMHARFDIPEVKFENFNTRTANEVMNYVQGYEVWVMRASAQYYNIAPTAHRQKRARESYDVNAGFVDQYQSDTCYALQGSHSLTNNGNSSASFSKSELPSLQYSEADFGAPVPKSADGGFTQLSYMSNRLSPLHNGMLDSVVLESELLCSGEKRSFEKIEEIHNEPGEGFIDIPETADYIEPKAPLISSSSLLLNSGGGRSEIPARFGLSFCAASENHANPESSNGNENYTLPDDVIKCCLGEELQIEFDDVASGILPAGGYGDCAWNSMPSASDDCSGGT